MNHHGLSVVRYFITGLLLTLFVTSQVSADPGQKAEAQNVRHKFVGMFGGYDSKEKLLWVNEGVYHYDYGLKVMGTATKHGSLSAINLKEKVTVLIESRGKGKMPMAIEIQRQ